MLIRKYDEIIEDILWLGSELYRVAQFLAEMRMIKEIFTVNIQKGVLFQVGRKFQLDSIFNAIVLKLKEDFPRGLFDEDGVLHLKDEIKTSFGIDYDFAAHQIIHIKQQLNLKNWEFQTIEPGILVHNLVANGVSQINAANFMTD